MSNEKSKNRKEAVAGKEKEGSKAVSYRLKCAKTANGLSHFVMYGDVPKEKTLL
ncbi:MAG: hypothetical protein WA066_00300 [Candidatus Omnitrophota bacterium]